MCSWPIRQAPDTISAVHSAVARAGSIWFRGIFRTPLPCCARSSPPVLRSARRTAACRYRQGADPLQHRPEQAPSQVTPRQEQSVVARVFHEPCARLDEALLETGQRPRVDPLREHEPPPEMPNVVGEPAQRPLDLVRLEPVTGSSCPRHRLLAFLDPWLGGPAPMAESHGGAPAN